MWQRCTHIYIHIYILLGVFSLLSCTHIHIMHICSLFHTYWCVTSSRPICIPKGFLNLLYVYIYMHTCLLSSQQIDALNLQGHWMISFFLAHMDLELQRNKQVCHIVYMHMLLFMCAYGSCMCSCMVHVFVVFYVCFFFSNLTPVCAGESKCWDMRHLYVAWMCVMRVCMYVFTYIHTCIHTQWSDMCHNFHSHITLCRFTHTHTHTHTHVQGLARYEALRSLFPASHYVHSPHTCITWEHTHACRGWLGTRLCEACSRHRTTYTHHIHA